MGSPNTSSLLSITLIIVLTSFYPLNCYGISNEITKIKGMFVFGSSLADNGNNNFLDTPAKVNYLPYGIDFPNGPTGRFANGKTVIDIFGDYLGIPHFIPPFYDPSTNGVKIVNGVDFASGGSGILDPGPQLGKVASLTTQIRNFQETTLPALEVQLGVKIEEFIGNYIFVVAIGANDYRENYFLHPQNQTVQVFTANLIRLLSGHIKNLYSLGGRKFVFMAAYPLGCYPVDTDAQNKCNQTVNDAAKLYNSQLKSMVDDLHSHMPGSHLVLVNSYDIVNDLITNPIPHGIKDVGNPCCEILVGPNGKKYSPCKRNGKVCKDKDRKTNIFFLMEFTQPKLSII